MELLQYTVTCTITYTSKHLSILCTSNNYNKVKYMYAMMKKTNSMFNPIPHGIGKSLPLTEGGASEAPPRI